MLRGIDVSQVQGRVDWAWVSSHGLSFAWLKAAEGNRQAPDPMFAPNVTGARAAGLTVGAYLFAYPLPPKAGEPLRDPAAQAAHHLELSEGLGCKSGDMPPCLDLEWPEFSAWARWGCGATQIRQWAVDYLDAAESLWGVTPLVYTYPYFATALGLRGDPRFARFRLWIASYGHNDPWPAEGAAPTIPPPWSEWAFWQTAGGTALALSNGSPVDTDVFNGDAAALRALCYRPAPPLQVAPIVAIEQPTPPSDLPPA